MKLYNEKEIGNILKRATEMSHADTNSSSMGLSVEELQQLGAEAGLNPDFIIRAAAELAVAPSIRKRNVVGGPVSFEREIVLDGEISSSDWEEFLAAIRSTFKVPGEVDMRENTYEWTIKAPGGNAQVTARLVDGTTRINVFWSEPAIVVPFMIPTVIGTIISLPITFEALSLSGLPGMAVILGTAATLFTLGRWGVSRYTDRFSNKLEQMVASIELIASKGELSRNRNKVTAATISALDVITHPLIDVEEAFSDEESEQTSRDRDRA